MITSSTHIPADAVPIGVPVMVIGHTNAQGFVEADTLEVLGPGVSLPPLEPSQMESMEAEESEDLPGEQPVPGAGQPEQLGNLTYEFKGVVESINGNLWTINGQEVNVEFAENSSSVSVGMLVEFKGYYSKDGQFIVTKIEVKSNGLLKPEPLKSSGKGSDGKDDSSGSNESSGGSESSNGGDENNNHSGHSDDHQENEGEE